MSGVVRFIALDEAHDRDLGYPVTPEDAPERVSEPVWAVYEQVPDAHTEAGYRNVQVVGGLTVAQAEEDA